MNNESFFNFDSVEDSLFLSVHKAGQDYCCKRIEGTDLVFGLFVSVSGNNEHNTVFKLKKPIQSWGKTEDELFEIAKRNTIRDSVCMPMWHILEKFMDPKDFERSECADLCDQSILVVSNTSGCFGGASVFIPEVAEHTGSSTITILPSSKHECIVLPNNLSDNKESLRDMISSINASVVAPEDVLSDTPYFYNPALGYFM